MNMSYGGTTLSDVASHDLQDRTALQAREALEAWKTSPDCLTFMARLAMLARPTSQAI
jgi:hypothetical protein